MTPPSASGSPSGHPSQPRPAPPSPSLSMSTDASALNFVPGAPPIILSKANLRSSLAAFENVITATAAFRQAILQLASASETLAVALEECSKHKGARNPRFSYHESSNTEQDHPHSHSHSYSEPLLSQSHTPSEKLMAAAGLHYLMSNHEHVLSDIILKEFESPLRQEYREYQALVTNRQIAYDKALQERSNIIRQTENENLRIGRRKQRDLQSFRNALATLQSQVDEMDALKANHYTDALEKDQDVWEKISSRVALVVKSEIDMFERIASKGASDRHIDSMVRANPDPYNVSGTQSDINIVSTLFNVPASVSSSSITHHHAPLARTLSSSPNKIEEEHESFDQEGSEDDQMQNGNNNDRIEDYNSNTSTTTNINNSNHNSNSNNYKRSSYAESSHSTVGRTDPRPPSSFSDVPSSSSHVHDWQSVSANVHHQNPSAKNYAT